MHSKAASYSVHIYTYIWNNFFSFLYNLYNRNSFVNNIAAMIILLYGTAKIQITYYTSVLAHILNAYSTARTVLNIVYYTIGIL